ncbi:hypothetical protein [Scardovia wiggsiae]|uniref:hypothetical protein n=1 Tax=Scardovia wiggsiae TaxID=230143 RepID=UPI00374EA97E
MEIRGKTDDNETTTYCGREHEAGSDTVGGGRQTSKELEQEARDKRYRELLLSPIRTCAEYLPKMGGSGGIDVKKFVELYQSDPLYHWMGFDSPLMFAAHKAAGGMTSLYRQLGIGVERLFRHILMDSFGLTEDQANWSYDYTKSNGSTATRYLDGRLDCNTIKSVCAGREKIVSEWVNDVRDRLGIKASLRGVVFEVREGYKSADSKRQNADLENLAQSLKHSYLMTMVLMSLQINETVRRRYQENGLLVLTGDASSMDPVESSFAFLKQIAGYDIIAFFERNTELLKNETTNMLERLLSKGDY